MKSNENSIESIIAKINEKRFDKIEILLEKVLETIKEGTLKDDLITPDEVCKRLQISRTTLWNYENKGFVKAKSIGQRRYYNWSEILKHLEEEQS